MRARFAALFAVAATLMTSPSALAAQSAADEAWAAFEDGRAAFDSGELGKALGFFRKAVEARHAVIDAKIAVLEAAIDPDILRSLKNSLLEYRKVLEKRGEAGALRIIDEARSAPGGASLVTMTALREKLRALRDYPEAEYWIGRVYAEESELDLARLQYEKAYAARGSLELPGFKYTLLYELAATDWAVKRYKDAELSWLAVLADDPLYASPGKKFTRDGIVRMLRKDGVGKVIASYASPALFALEAHVRLCYYYYRLGDYDSAMLHGALGAITFFTSVGSRLSEDDPDFSIAGLGAALGAAASDKSIAAFADSSGIRGALYYLANSLYLSSSRAQAIAIWKALSAPAESGEWKAKAASQLIKPAFEAAAPLP